MASVLPLAVLCATSRAFSSAKSLPVIPECPGMYTRLTYLSVTFNCTFGYTYYYTPPTSPTFPVGSLPIVSHITCTCKPDKPEASSCHHRDWLVILLDGCETTHTCKFLGVQLSPELWQTYRLCDIQVNSTLVCYAKPSVIMIMIIIIVSNPQSNVKAMRLLLFCFFMGNMYKVRKQKDCFWKFVTLVYVDVE